MSASPLPSPRIFFYKILGEQTGLDIVDEASLLPCVVSLARAKRAYDKIKSALDQVEATGYGIVMPHRSEIVLEEPELIRHGNKYGIKIHAQAPSINLIKAHIETEIAPIVGSEEQARDLIAYMKENAKKEEKRHLGYQYFLGNP